MSGRLRDDSGRFKARTYEVTVWNLTNGDIEKYVDAATEAELKDIEENYDEPFYDIQIEENSY
jgi:hypothetical protein